MYLANTHPRGRRNNNSNQQNQQNNRNPLHHEPRQPHQPDNAPHSRCQPPRRHRYVDRRQIPVPSTPVRPRRSTQDVRAHSIRSEYSAHQEDLWRGTPDRMRTNWPSVHYKRRNLVPQVPPQQDSVSQIVNSVMNSPSSDLQEKLRKLELNAPHISDDRGTTDGSNVEAVRAAEAINIYEAVNGTAITQENPDPTKTDRDNYRDLLNGMDKINDITDVIFWFEKFEYSCNAFRVPVSDRYLKLHTKSLGATLKQKYLPARQITDLSDYNKLKRWLVTDIKIRTNVRKRLKALKEWKITKKTMKETFLDFKNTELQYSKAISFALQNGIPEWEIEPDKPDERALFLTFLNGMPASIRKELYDLVVKYAHVKNVSTLEPFCTY